MTTNSDRRARRAAGALAAAATLAMLSQPGEAAAAAAKLVSLDKIDGIQSSRVLDNGDVEIRMNDGRVVRIAAQDVVVQDGAIMVEASALADAGISLGGAGAGVSSTLLYAGVGVAAIGGGIAAGLSSGSDAVEAPPVNRAPAFTSAAAINTPENSSATGITLTASDPDNDQVTFSITGGADAARFAINGATGALTFVTPPNFEAPSDANADNQFEVTVTASDGRLSTAQTIIVTVTNVNDVAPVISSAAAVSVQENRTTVLTAAATDVEGGTITFSISGGDAALFVIDPSTGVITFRQAPNFEAPTDTGANNVYNFNLTASDGTNSSTQAVTVTVTDVPALTGTAGNDVLVGTGIVEELFGLEGNDRIEAAGGSDTITTGSGSDTLVYAGDPFDGGNVSAPGRQVIGNEDFVTDFAFAGDVYQFNARDFGITGDVVFASLDANAAGATIPVGANVIVLLNSDNDNNATTAFNAGTAANQIAALVTTDGPGFFVYWNSTLGVTRLVYSTNLNDPAADLKIISRHTDLNGAAAIAALPSFTAANFDFDRAPAFSSATAFNAGENRTSAFTAVAADGDGSALTFSLGGADAALFNIDPVTGVVTFRAAPDFEAPADAGANNVYDVVVTATDGRNATTQNVAVTVSDVPALAGTAGNDVLVGTGIVEELFGLEGNDRIEAAGGSDTITTGSGSDTLVYAGDPFDGGNVSAPGRQVIGNEDFVTDFAFAGDVYQFNARDFGITGDVVFASLDANAAGATIPVGANVIVLLNSDNDNNATTAFNAGTAANQIAALVTTDGPGFFVYWNSTLGVTRLVYSTNLNDPAADLKIISRHTDLNGAAAIAALNNFIADNFRLGGETLIGTEGIDTLTGFGGADTIRGLAGGDTIITNGGPDRVAYDATSIGSAPDALVDFSVTSDRFLLDATSFGVNGPLQFQRGLAANLVDNAANVIVLLDSDNDANPATAFNARSAAQLIGAQINADGAGFFVYFNSALNVNRLVFSANLADGNAALTVLGAVNTVTGQAAIDQLAQYSAANFEFGTAPAAPAAGAFVLTDPDVVTLTSADGLTNNAAFVQFDPAQPAIFGDADSRSEPAPNPATSDVLDDDFPAAVALSSIEGF